VTEPTWQDQPPASANPVERARRDLRLSGDQRFAPPPAGPPPGATAAQQAAPPPPPPGPAAPAQAAPAQSAPAQAAPAPIAAAPVAPPATPAVAQDGEPFTPSADLRRGLAALRAEVGKAVVGQDAAVTGLVIALLCRGHVLLEGVPGVAKTLLVRTLSTALSLDTKRVQFTPDLMPGDVTGSLVYDARTAQFSFREGPVFTNLLLADEINRTPPKTQASLLEAMEERQVSVDGTPRMLPDPFLVIATQNPVEYEGTYPLPEAQLDRFLLKLTLPLPERHEEIEVLRRHAAGFDPRNLAAAGVRPVTSAAELARARAEVAQVQISPEVLGYAVDVCRATRQSPSLSLGVSPRGATALLATARAWAWLSGRGYVTPDDIKALAHPTLRHRVQLRAEAELEGVTAESVLDTVLAAVPVPR
jgi:MoxR-like ATPase